MRDILGKKEVIFDVPRLESNNQISLKKMLFVLLNDRYESIQKSVVHFTNIRYTLENFHAG